MKFLVPNHYCLCPQLNLLNPPPQQNSWAPHCYLQRIIQRSTVNRTLEKMSNIFGQNIGLF